jgi:hypothetical protein
MAWLFLIDIRARSVELTEEGISFRRLRVGVMPKLIKQALRWNEVERIEVASNVVRVTSQAHEVIVNTLLFDKPDEVVEFIQRSMAKASGQAP